MFIGAVYIGPCSGCPWLRVTEGVCSMEPCLGSRATGKLDGPHLVVQDIQVEPWATPEGQTMHEHVGFPRLDFSLLHCGSGTTVKE